MGTAGQLTVFFDAPTTGKPQANGDQRGQGCTAYSTCSLGWKEGPPCYAVLTVYARWSAGPTTDFILLSPDFSRSSLS